MRADKQSTPADILFDDMQGQLKRRNTMRLAGFMTILGAAAFMAGTASAQTVGIGTTKTGATSQVTAAIAKVASKFGNMQMRTAPMAGTQKYIPAVNAGKLEFGAANIMQTTWAVEGKVLSEGRPNPNILMVATLMPFRTGIITAKDPSIKSLTDLKGKRGPVGYKAAPLFVELMKAALATSNMTMNDYQAVPVAALVPSWKALMEKKIDFAYGAAGSGFMNRISQALGGMQFVSIDNSPEAVARLNKYAPGAEIKTLQPRKGLTGINGPTNLVFFDYTLFAGKTVSDEVVYRVTKAMYENKAALVESSPLWRGFTAKNMSKKQGNLKYHPGAIKLYKEKGTWNQ
jgi:TRAP transporter TAXI family solute receptor